MGVIYPILQMERLRPTKLTCPVQVVSRGVGAPGSHWESLKCENGRPIDASAHTLERHCALGTLVGTVCSILQGMRDCPAWPALAGTQCCPQPDSAPRGQEARLAHLGKPEAGLE